MEDVSNSMSYRAEDLDDANLKRFLQWLIHRTGVPGIAVSLYKGGEELTVCAGVADAHHTVELESGSRFQSGCIVKLLTCMTALTLAQSGEINLEAPIHDYLEVPHLEKSGHDVLVWHLLSHTSGIGLCGEVVRSLGKGGTESTVTELLGHSRQLFRPGSVFNYSAFDHFALATILERVARQPLAELLQQRLLEPAGLKSGSHEGDRRHHRQLFVEHHVWNWQSKCFRPHERQLGDVWLLPVADLTLSVRDLIALAKTIILPPSAITCGTGGNASGDIQIVGFRALFRSVVQVPCGKQGLWEHQLPSAYGLGCAHFFDEFIGHPGSSSGQCCSVRFDPGRSMAVAVGINAPTLTLRDGITRSLCRWMRGADDQQVNAVDVPPTFEETEVHGVFRGGDGRLDLSIEPSSSRKWILRIANPSVGLLLERPLALDDEDHLVVGSTGEDSRLHYPLRFFRDPFTGALCLMLGWHAYRRT
jgi:hypothetical protein